jgi:uncharacterized protein (DUF2141 family)
MKKIILLSILLISPIKTFAFDINVEILNVKNNIGKIYIALYNSKDTFLVRSKMYKGLIREAESNTMTCTFQNIPKGTYAIALFHDENLNEKLDKNFFRIPTEGYGISNNAQPMFGPPRFDNAKFNVDSNYHTQINMKY